MLILANISLLTYTQNSSCDGIRYLESVFDEVKVTTDVKYGMNITVGGDTVELFMDIYEPENDYATERPVVFILHGGGFYTGSKSAPQFVVLSTEFARKGYIAVSLDYRLYDLAPTPPDSLMMMDVIFKASVDFKAAMRFMYADASLINTYKVDTNYFFAGGMSAGSVIAMTTAYLDDINEAPNYLKQIIMQNGGMQGNSSTNLQYNPQLKAVFNASGGIHRKEFVDSDDPPCNSFHANGDQVMPYKRGYISLFNQQIIEMDGSFNVHGELGSYGIRSELSTIIGNIHLSYLHDSVMWDSLVISSSRMFRNIACEDITTRIHEKPGKGSINREELIEVYPNPAKEYINIISTDTDDCRFHKVFIVEKNGSVIQEHEIRTMPASRLNINNLKPGFYILLFQMADGKKIRKKLVVNH